MIDHRLILGPLLLFATPPPLSPSGERPGLGCLRQPRAGALHQGPKLHARYFAELHRGYKTTLAAGVRHFALTRIPVCPGSRSRSIPHVGRIPAEMILISAGLYLGPPIRLSADTCMLFSRDCTICWHVTTCAIAP